MLPLFDDNSAIRRTPLVNNFLLAANIIVFLFFQQYGQDEQFVLKYSLLPTEILSGKDMVVPGLHAVSPHPVFLTLITSMFLHSGFMHLLGNLWFLFIFGNNVEDALGRIAYLFFYLFSGVAAALFYILLTIWTDNNPYVPMLGASGAISGVVAAYAVLFPRNMIKMPVVIDLKWFIFIARWFNMPAAIPVRASFWIGIWVVTQFLGCLSMLSDKLSGSGIAYAAHLGGCLFGCLAMIGLLLIRKSRCPQKTPAVIN